MSIRKIVSVLALSAAAATMSAVATAQDKWPLVFGDYWEVTGIDIKDGGGLSYAQWLASEWKDNLEFSKSQGWIKGYKLFSNVHARAGEPDLYLVTISESIVSAAEGDKRFDGLPGLEEEDDRADADGEREPRGVSRGPERRVAAGNDDPVTTGRRSALIKGPRPRAGVSSSGIRLASYTGVGAALIVAVRVGGIYSLQQQSSCGSIP